MSDEELERTIAALDAVMKEYGSSPEKARAYLVKIGIVTPDGELTENYRQSA
jgi:hypothetical protein